jgi:biopolymer transport protein ExbD
VRITAESFSITLRIFNIKTRQVESTLSTNTAGKIDKILNQDIPLIIYKIVGRKTINIEVTKAGLKCDNNLITYLDPLRSEQKDILIAELQNYLSKEVTKADSLISNEIINFLEVILRGDNNLTYDLFFRIVYTIIQSNISNIRLANLNPPFMVVPISLKPGQGDIEQEEKLGFTVAIAPDGFFLSFNSTLLSDSNDSEVNFVATKIERDSLGNYDFEQLNRELYDMKMQIKKAPKDIDSAIILANKNVKFGLVLSTANAIRSHTLENGEEFILFPSINFGQIVE